MKRNNSTIKHLNQQTTTTMGNEYILHYVLVQVLDVLPFLLTIIGNILCLVVLFKKRSLHTPSNVFLGAMCISDLFVGFIVQPFFIINCNIPFHGNYSFVSTELCAKLMGAGCSFLIAIMISVDRYTAICHPFYYVKVANCQTNLVIAGTASALYCAMCIIMLALNKGVYLSVCLLIVGMSGYLVVIVTYCLIYRVIYKQRRVAVTIGEIVGSTRHEVRRMHKERSRTFTIAFVLLALLICYAPSFFLLIYFNWVDRSKVDSTIDWRYVDVWASFILLLSSCFNPILYCLRCTEVRKAVFMVLRLNRIGREQNTVAKISRMEGENDAEK